MHHSICNIILYHFGSEPSHIKYFRGSFLHHRSLIECLTPVVAVTELKTEIPDSAVNTNQNLTGCKKKVTNVRHFGGTWLLSYSIQYWKKLPVVQRNILPPSTPNEGDGSNECFWKMWLLAGQSRSLKSVELNALYALVYYVECSRRHLTE